MSHFYIINTEAGHGIYRKIATRLKQILLNLDIAGEFVVATPADNFTELAHLGLRRGYKTIVAVGGSDTVNKVSLALIQAQKGIFGIIPIGKKNYFAKILGLSSWEHACYTLAARRINRIDAGACGSHTFLTGLCLSSSPSSINYLEQPEKQPLSDKKNWAKISADDKFVLEGPITKIIVSNVAFGQSAKYSLFDGQLHLLTSCPEKKFGLFGKSNKFGKTYIHAKKFCVQTQEPLKIFLDETPIGHTPCEIQTIPGALRAIVERDRAENL